jgi:hypothetical protein
MDKEDIISPDKVKLNSNISNKTLEYASPIEEK